MDIDRLLAPVPGDSPSGVELRNDARFHSIERLLEPAARENRLNDDGTVNLSAPSVEWHRVLDEGQDLAGDGRDLRLLVMLVRAQYNSEGFSGLVTGLEMLTRTVSEYWDSLHPELRDRPDPKAASLPRLNALKQLENDDNGLLGDMRFGVVLSPRGIGPITGDDLSEATLSDFEIMGRSASGLNQSEKDAILAQHEKTANRVKAACRAMAAEQAEEAAAMVEAMKASEDGITRLLAAITGVSGIPDGMGLILPELTEFLQLCCATLEQAIAAESGTDAADTSAGDAAEPAGAAPAPAGGGAPAKPAQQGLSGTINSRADVDRALGQIVAFYERTEPSSPVPLLAKRLQRVVGMTFEELIEELAPGGLKEFYNVAGVDPKKK